MSKKITISKERLIEYQKAHDSAEHYNNMIWTLMALGIAGSLTILHIVWAYRPGGNSYGLIMLFIGAFILTYFSYLIEGANEKKRWKYAICNKIENEGSFIGQNLKVDNLPTSKGVMGMKILRMMKVLLFFLYIVSIIVGLGSVVLEGGLNSFISWGVILVLLAIVGSIALEGIYARNERKLNKIISEELPLKEIKSS